MSISRVCSIIQETFEPRKPSNKCKCKLRKEKFTLEDKAKLLYVQKLAEGTSLQPQLHSTSTDSQGTTSLCQGWALRQVKKSGRFNDNQQNYLDEKFLIGQPTGIKYDPSQVARK